MQKRYLLMNLLIIIITLTYMITYVEFIINFVDSVLKIFIYLGLVFFSMILTIEFDKKTDLAKVLSLLIICSIIFSFTTIDGNIKSIENENSIPYIDEEIKQITHKINQNILQGSFIVVNDFKLQFIIGGYGFLPVLFVINSNDPSQLHYGFVNESEARSQVNVTFDSFINGLTFPILRNSLSEFRHYVYSRSIDNPDHLQELIDVKLQFIIATKFTNGSIDPSLRLGQFTYERVLIKSALNYPIWYETQHVVIWKLF